MQQKINKSKKLFFSPSFLEKFTTAINKVYHYKKYMDYLIVPSLLGKKTLSYLPIVNYTDRTSNNLTDLLELAKDNSYNIKVLNFLYKEFKANDTVAMRLDIGNKNSEQLFQTCMKSRCRNKIRNSIKKYDYIFRCGNSIKDIDDFYNIFTSTMHKHGTPPLDKKLFIYLSEEFIDDILFCNVYDKEKVIASMCIIIDDELAWYGWGGVDSNYNRNLAGYFIYWQALKYICDNKDVKIFDFGRSSYGGGTYNFKSQFGAYPVKIDIISSQNEDIYSKYSLASKIWKKLPKSVVDFIGPKLCKYLVDL